MYHQLRFHRRKIKIGYFTFYSLQHKFFIFFSFKLNLILDVDYNKNFTFTLKLEVNKEKKKCDLNIFRWKIYSMENHVICALISNKKKLVLSLSRGRENHPIQWAKCLELPRKSISISKFVSTLDLIRICFYFLRNFNDEWTKKKKYESTVFLLLRNTLHIDLFFFTLWTKTQSHSIQSANWFDNVYIFYFVSGLLFFFKLINARKLYTT